MAFKIVFKSHVDELLQDVSSGCHGFIKDQIAVCNLAASQIVLLEHQH